MTTATATMQTIGKTSVEIYGTAYSIGVGSYIDFDHRLGECLLPSDWERADFRMPTRAGGPIESVAVNVELTGRTFQRRPYSDDLWIKARVEFVGDDEPSTFAPAWFLARR